MTRAAIEVAPSAFNTLLEDEDEVPRTMFVVYILQWMIFMKITDILIMKLKAYHPFIDKINQFTHIISTKLLFILLFAHIPSK